MKLGPLSKLGKENMMALKQFDGDVMLANYGVFVILPFHGRFGNAEVGFRMYAP